MQTGEKNNISYKESKLQRFFKKIYERLIKIRGEPREIALGFALGIFIGMSPTMGFQIAIAVFFAAVFKWNKLSSAIGVWITNPLTAPIIYSITYFIGAKLLGLKKADIISDNLGGGESIFQLLSKTPEIIWAMVIGGIVLGLPLAILAYYFSYSAVRKYQDDIKSKIAEKREKMIMKREEKKRKKREKESPDECS